MFVVDSGASTHVLSKKDLNSAECASVRVVEKPNKNHAKGEVQTNEEATVYVRDVDLIVTVQLLDDTLRVFFGVQFKFDSLRTSPHAGHLHCLTSVSLFQKNRGTHSRRYVSKRAMVPQSSIGLGKRCVQILKKLCQNMATFFFSPSEVRCLPTPSTIKPEEREIVVDSGTSIYMLSKKDLNAAEFETVRVSRNPTKIIAPNCEVQTNKESAVYVRDFDLIVTVQLLEDTPRDFFDVEFEFH